MNERITFEKGIIKVVVPANDEYYRGYLEIYIGKQPATNSIIFKFIVEGKDGVLIKEQSFAVEKRYIKDIAKFLIEIANWI